MTVKLIKIALNLNSVSISDNLLGYEGEMNIWYHFSKIDTIKKIRRNYYIVFSKKCKILLCKPVIFWFCY